MLVPLVVHAVLRAVIELDGGPGAHWNAQERLLVSSDAKLDPLRVCYHGNVAPVRSCGPQPGVVVGRDLVAGGQPREKAAYDAVGVDPELAQDWEQLLGPRLLWVWVWVGDGPA